MNEIGNNLKRIRLLKNMSLKQAGNLLNMSATAVSKYEKGLIVPDGEKLILFADAYGVDVRSFLESYKLPKMKFTSFRKERSLCGQRLELLKDIIEREVAKNFEVIEMGEIEKNAVKLKTYSCNSFDDVEKASSKFRKLIKIGELQPLSDLINMLENMGIVVIQIKDDENKFSDFLGLSEIVNNIPVIVISENIKDGARQRFTIAHELAHLVLDCNNLSLSEKLCNRFAGSLLMPKESIINEFGVLRKNISFFELNAFRKEYKVSLSAILCRLRELNIISEYLYKKLNTIRKNNVGKIESFRINPEVSLEFRKNVHRLEIDNIISIDKACELLGVSANEYNEENNNYGY